LNGRRQLLQRHSRQTTSQLLLSVTGLPDSIFSNQKSSILDKFLEGLAMEGVGFLYGLLYILRSFGLFYGYWVYFSRFGMLYEEKSGNPGQ
jgi:hypothetical protein